MPRETLTIADIEPSIGTEDVAGALVRVRCDICSDRWSLRVNTGPKTGGTPPTLAALLATKSCTRCGNRNLKLERIWHPRSDTPTVFRKTSFLRLFGWGKTKSGNGG